MTKLLHGLVIAAISLVLTGPADAGGRVDWSDYIDRTPQKPIAVAPARAVTPVVSGKRATKATKATKAAKSKKSAKATKARKKATKKKARR